ncbi:MAG TPA: serine/threonine-protein kinase, partial [Streptosporangiaceae bacterium]|nr:serine/threonine-protein kinase [Streptosporangiaceae bacterium]
GLAKALGAVHAAGVVHRDLKPGNVMVSDGEPVVIDFGIAQLAETTRLTMTGMFMGTPGYLAPEVIEGQDSGPASDVHSWGATVAFAALGRPPFGSGTFEAIFFRIMHGQPDLSTLPSSLRPLVNRALARDPASRPSADDLAAWAAGLDPETLIPGPGDYSPTDFAQASPGFVPGPGPAPGPGFGAGPGFGPPAGAQTVADQADRYGQPTYTRPMPSGGPDDVRDLLPPVRYGSAAALFSPGPPAAPYAGSPAGSPGAAGIPPNGAGPIMPAGGLGGAAAGAALGPTLTGGPPGPAPGNGQLALRGQPGLGQPGLGQPGLGQPGLGLPGLGQPGPGSFGNVGQRGQFGPQAGGAARPAARGPADISPWSPLVLASILIVASVSVMAPIIGTAVALALLILLRAAASTSRRLERRAQSDGGRAGPAFVGMVLYPLAVLRAIIGIVLLSPVALLGASVAAAATIIAVPNHPLPQALAFAAGTLIAIVGLGPGSSGSRQVLAGCYGSVGRSPGRLAIAYVGVLSICAWAVVTAWYQSPAALYWPVVGLHAKLDHLPTLHTLLTDIRHNLLNLGRQFGL